MGKSFQNRLLKGAWELGCIASIFPIWPRYIEHRLLFTTHFTLSLPHLHQDLENLRIVHFSDLHIGRHQKDAFLRKLTKRIHQLQPDLICFSGDFLCHSQLSPNQEKRLLTFLKGLKARYGHYAVLGNHDFARYLSINKEGIYDVLQPGGSSILAGIRRLTSPPQLQKKLSAQALAVHNHPTLTALLEKTPFQVLENQTVQVPIGQSFLNLCGLGEYWAGRFDPQHAFQNYASCYPGVVLGHNPDTAPHLKGYPGELTLYGHTHGGQIHLPWIWKRISRLENLSLKRGELHCSGRKIYINRGVGASFPFRCFSPPELLSITLKKEV